MTATLTISTEGRTSTCAEGEEPVVTIHANECDFEWLYYMLKTLRVSGPEENLRKEAMLDHVQDMAQWPDGFVTRYEVVVQRFHEWEPVIR